MFTEKELFDIFGYYEKSRFIQVTHYYRFTCPHLEPSDRTAIGLEIAHPVMNNTTIRLRMHRLGENRLGYAGKCEVCGKVYYK